MSEVRGDVRNRETKQQDVMSFVIFSSRYLIFIVNLNNVNKGRKERPNFTIYCSTASRNFNTHCVIGRGNLATLNME